MTVLSNKKSATNFNKNVSTLEISIENAGTTLQVNGGRTDQWVARCRNGTEWGTNNFDENEYSRVPILHEFRHFLKNFNAKICMLSLRIADDTFSIFGENIKVAVLKEVERILAKRDKLRVKIFRVICSTFHEEDLTPILGHLCEHSLEKIDFVQLGQQSIDKIDLHNTALLPQWKHLKSLHSDFMMASSHWAHVPCVSFKVPVLERTDFTKLLEVIGSEFCFTKSVHLFAKHLSMKYEDLIDIFSVDGQCTSDGSTTNQWKRGEFAWCFKDGNIEVHRQSDMIIRTADLLSNFRFKS